ncbi:hypothetical protein [Fischerella sp. JS2]|uniref:hypothetical protein n=1 Tax=Fischerella sp. JS2 TaxID=2597771 RepID=UPI0028E1D4C5|nr:hypothetical protein [Fischerella sp. JS2]
MNCPSGSPPCQPLREAALRLPDGDRQDGKWTHQDAKNAKNFSIKRENKIIPQICNAVILIAN